MLVSYPFDTAGVNREEGISAEKIYLSEWPIASLWNIFLIHYCVGMAQPIMGGADPRQVALGYIRK